MTSETIYLAINEIALIFYTHLPKDINNTFPVFVMIFFNCQFNGTNRFRLRTGSDYSGHTIHVSWKFWMISHVLSVHHKLKKNHWPHPSMLSFQHVNLVHHHITFKIWGKLKKNEVARDGDFCA